MTPEQEDELVRMTEIFEKGHKADSDMIAKLTLTFEQMRSRESNYKLKISHLEAEIARLRIGTENIKRSYDFQTMFGQDDEPGAK